MSTTQNSSILNSPWLNHCGCYLAVKYNIIKMDPRVKRSSIFTKHKGLSAEPNNTSNLVRHQATTVDAVVSQIRGCQEGTWVMSGTLLNDRAHNLNKVIYLRCDVHIHHKDKKPCRWGKSDMDTEQWLLVNSSWKTTHEHQSQNVLYDTVSFLIRLDTTKQTGPQCQILF